jgi:hypothetical protein
MKYMHYKLRTKRAGHVVSMERRGAYRVLVGKREGKKPLGKHRQRRDNTKIRRTVWTGLT